MEFYDDIKDLVENTTQSYRSIAEQYGTNHTQIKKIAIRDKWKIEHRVSKNSNIDNLPTDAPHKNILGKTAIRKIVGITRFSLVFIDSDYMVFKNSGPSLTPLQKKFLAIDLGCLHKPFVSTNPLSLWEQSDNYAPARF